MVTANAGDDFLGYQQSLFQCNKKMKTINITGEGTETIETL